MTATREKQVIYASDHSNGVTLEQKGKISIVIINKQTNNQTNE